MINSALAGKTRGNITINDHENNPPLTRRPHCPRCLRPARTCICHLVEPVDNAVEVVILQHPLEVKNAKSTGRLLHLCLKNSQLVVGEQLFADNKDNDLSALLADQKTTLLLYPPADNPNPEAPRSTPPPDQLRLIILDGTWRKTRKLLHLNPSLAALPRLTLPQGLQSRYRIRKAQRPHQLSTIEAAAAALSQCERNDTHKYQPLLRSFEQFIDQQITQMGRDIFEKHYNC